LAATSGLPVALEDLPALACIDPMQSDPISMDRERVAIGDVSNAGSFSLRSSRAAGEDHGRDARDKPVPCDLANSISPRRSAPFVTEQVADRTAFRCTTRFRLSAEAAESASQQVEDQERDGSLRDGTNGESYPHGEASRGAGLFG